MRWEGAWEDSWVYDRDVVARQGLRAECAAARLERAVPHSFRAALETRRDEGSRADRRRAEKLIAKCDGQSGPAAATWGVSCRRLIGSRDRATFSSEPGGSVHDVPVERGTHSLTPADVDRQQANQEPAARAHTRFAASRAADTPQERVPSLI